MDISLCTFTDGLAKGTGIRLRRARVVAQGWGEGGACAMALDSK